MNIILDTHIFLWLISEDKRLTEDKIQAILNPNNEVFLSVISIWECVIKYQIGKLQFPESPEIYLPEKRSQHFIKTLSIRHPQKRLFDRLVVGASALLLRIIGDVY